MTLGTIMELEADIGIIPLPQNIAEEITPPPTSAGQDMILHHMDVDMPPPLPQDTAPLPGKDEVARRLQ